jgi:hypothetical protein
MKIVSKKYDHYLNIDIPVDLERTDDYKLYIVYFINCLKNPNYFSWIVGHISKVINDPFEELYIIAQIQREKEDDFKKSVLKIFPNVKIECHYENEYEYRGILKAWELGKIHSKNNDIILYFHSKGISYSYDFAHARDWGQNGVVSDFGKIKEIFNIFPTIDKIGYQTGITGVIIINFWYVRGSWIKNLVRPPKTGDRFYYEIWLAETENAIPFKTVSTFDYIKNCYQFYTDKSVIANIGSFFHNQRFCNL